MSSPIWILWLMFLFLVLVAPVGYGWGYRGWGMAYPRYVQDRRHARGHDGAFDHKAWGRAGDLVWLGIIVSAVWALVAFAVVR